MEGDTLEGLQNKSSIWKSPQRKTREKTEGKKGLTAQLRLVLPFYSKAWEEVVGSRTILGGGGEEGRVRGGVGGDATKGPELPCKMRS